MNQTNIAYGLAAQETVRALNGLEFLQRICSGQLPQAPIFESMQCRMVEAQDGFTAIEGHPSLSHYNPIGSVHGGWFGVLLDSCMGCAVQTTLEQGVGYTTVEYSVNLVRAIDEHTGPVRAEGHVVHRGGRLATAEGRLADREGKLLAHGTTTCMIIPLPEAAKS